MFNKNNVIGTILLISIGGAVLFLPQIGLADDEISLPQKDTEIFLNKIPLCVVEECSSEYFRTSFTPEEQVAILLIRAAINNSTVEFLGGEITKIFLKAPIKTLLFLYATPDVKDIIDKIESESKEAALKYLDDWLNQKEIKTATGEVNFSYRNYKEVWDTVSFQYTLTYHPQSDNKGIIAAEFYSLNPIYPPLPKGSCGDPSGFPWQFSEWLNNSNNNGKKIETIDPFIVRIKTEVEKKYGSYVWDKSFPIDIEVEFPEVVPDIRLEEPSLVQKVKNIFDTIKSLAGEFSLWIEARLPWLSELNEIADFSRLEEIGKLIKEAQEAQKVSSEAPEDLAQPYSGQPIETSGEPFGLIETQEEAGELPVEAKPQQEEVEEGVGPVEAKPQQQSQQQEEVSWCNPAGQTPAQKKVIFNEIAWMGTTNSSNDEWMELKNISGQTINLANWQLFDQQKQIKIIFENTVFISAGGFYLLERTDDNSVPFVAADKIYTGSLSNSDETLYLFNVDCQLQDTVSADPDWPAGNNLNMEKRTMERNSDLQGWHTYSGYQNNGIWGTPKVKNSPAVFEEKRESSGGSSAATAAAASYVPPYTPPKILITEIQIEGESKQHDFIEIYNPSQNSVDISNWKLRKKTQGGAESSLGVFPDGSIIAANSYFLWANGEDENYPNLIQADISFKSYYLTENNSIVLLDRYDNIIDALAWGSGLQNPFFEKSPFNQNPEKFQSLERKTDQGGKYIDNNDNLNDFQIQNCPNPKSKVIECYSPPPSDDGESIPTPTPTPTPTEEVKILISEIQIFPIAERFVELYNPNDEDIDLTGWYIQRKTKGATSWGSFITSTQFEGKIIQSKTYSLISRTIENSDILLGTLTLTEDNSIVLKNPKREVVDLVGWGAAAQDFETEPAPNPDEYQSIGRKWMEEAQTYQDTNNNYLDFEIQVPTPKAQNRKDITPPETEIISGPSLLTNSVSAEFYFQANKENCSFECKLDESDWEDCSSPKVYENLEDGQHAFLVRATDLFSNVDENPAEYSWTIDTTIESPSLSLFDLNAYSSFYTNQNLVGANIFVTHPEDGVKWFLSEINKKPTADSNWLHITPITYDFVSPCRDGLKTVWIWSQDEAGNISELGNSDSIILDTITPTAQLGELELFQNSVTFTVSWSGSDPGPAENVLTSGVSTYTVQYNTSPSDGVWLDWLIDIIETRAEFSGEDGYTYMYRLRAKDNAGNVGGWSEKIFTTVDITPPSVEFSLSPIQSSLGFTLSWQAIDPIKTVSASGIDGFNLMYTVSSSDGGWLKLPNREIWPPGEEGTLGLGESQTELNPEGEDGTIYNFEIRAKDRAGNQSNWENASTAISLPFPYLEIIFPEPGRTFVFPETQVSIKGKTDPLGFVFISETDYQTQADENGDWQIEGVVLNSGPNVFNIVARNQFGKETSATLTVYLEIPVLEVSPTEFNFVAKKPDEDLESQILIIKNRGEGDLRWYTTPASPPSWLSLQSTSGIVPANSSSATELSVDISGLGSGEYSAIFNIQSDNATNSPQQILVNLTVGNLIENATTLWPGDFGYLTVRDAEVVLKPGQYNFKDLVLEDGAKLILESNLEPDFSGFRGVKILAENIEICDDCEISTDGKGYPAGQGPGAGIVDKQCKGGYGCPYYYYYGSGGGYGGKGGNGNGGVKGGDVYGSITEPMDLGSGGGGGGAGGGAIKLIVTDDLRIDGIISARGIAGNEVPGSSYMDRGGGSGGNIYIDTGFLSGEGLLTANGGESGFGGSGGGGGGRIAIEYDSKENFSGDIQAYGGSGYKNGGAGTIYLKSLSQEYGDLIIDNNDLKGITQLIGDGYNFDNIIVFNSVHLYLPENLNANNFEVGNNSILEAEATTTIIVSGQFIFSSSSLLGPTQTILSIEAGSLILESESEIKANVKIIASNLFIDSSSLILADGKGYPAGQGPGAGIVDKQCRGGYGCPYYYYYGSGGGYGGKGGNSYASSGGSEYGTSTLTTPTDFGSGGGSDIGSAGGGAIWIEAANTLEINGTVSANGEDENRGTGGSTSLDRGGGSGGSIYIKTNNILIGEGLISAYGGRGASGGGGGAGGRIAIEEDVSEFTGEIGVDGGTGYQNGEEGTVVIIGSEGEM